MNQPIPTPVSAEIKAGLDHYWLPFTSNRYFREHPKLLASAQGAYYTTVDGKKLFDCLSGLWCAPLGHAHPAVVSAVEKQVRTLDYSTAFQLCNPFTLQLAERVANLAPDGLDHVFFSNSGSEAVDTAVKIAYGYHRLRGEGGRTRFIGRERGYHGVGITGISLGGMVANRKMFGPLTLQATDHLPHTHSLPNMAFSRGQPSWGAHLADELERLVALHDASNIAAVIVEPMAGSTGVLAPPVGYLQKLREICTKHGILLIFDEVITGFGRMGTNFAAQRFGVTPDLITFAKAVTNGVVPLGGVITSRAIYDTYMGVQAAPWAVELFHGYTYSGHPMATGTGLAVLETFAKEKLFDRARELETVLENAVHALKGEAGIVDIRNSGLAAGVDLLPIPGKPGLRALKVFEYCFEHGQLLRFTGDTIAMGPPFISTEEEIKRMGAVLGEAIRQVMKDTA